METIFWNIISAVINITVNVPNGINGIEYLGTDVMTLFITKFPLELLLGGTNKR